MVITVVLIPLPDTLTNEYRIDTFTEHLYNWLPIITGKLGVPFRDLAVPRNSASQIFGAQHGAHAVVSERIKKKVARGEKRHMISRCTARMFFLCFVIILSVPTISIVFLFLFLFFYLGQEIECQNRLHRYFSYRWLPFLLLCEYFSHW